MKFTIAALIFPLILLGPILDDKEAIFFGKARDHYDVYADMFDSIKIEGEPFTFRVGFRPHPDHGFKCDEDLDVLQFVMPKELWNDSVPHMDYEKPITSEYCHDVQELRWDVRLNSYSAGKHKIDLFFKFEFCTNIKSTTGYICLEEHRQVTTHIIIDKRSKWIP